MQHAACCAVLQCTVPCVVTYQCVGRSGHRLSLSLSLSCVDSMEHATLRNPNADLIIVTMMLMHALQLTAYVMYMYAVLLSLLRHPLCTIIVISYEQLQKTAALAAAVGLGQGQADAPALLEHLCRFHCNNFGIVNSLFAPEGAGCYPWGALLNHGCSGNCVLTYAPDPVTGR